MVLLLWLRDLLLWLLVLLFGLLDLLLWLLGLLLGALLLGPGLLHALGAHEPTRLRVPLW